VVPQAAALLLTYPVLAATRDYSAVVSLSLAQAVAGLLLSHILAKHRYRLAFDLPLLKRQLSFGWPILASALPLIAVYQGDRLIIGTLSGMEALANYTAAFMITMVPGLIAAKVGHALLLPLFSDAIRREQSLVPKFKIASEATVVLAAVYLAGFIAGGDTILPLVFGANYVGLGGVTAWLAGMWALRMIQAVPGMALMAHGETKPFFVAGVVRALALPCVYVAATRNADIATLAATGFGFEALSLIYVAWRLERLEGGLGAILLIRAAYLAPVALAAFLAASATPLATLAAVLSAGAAMIAAGACGLAIMPALNALLRRALQSRGAVAAVQ
ncbi:MAG: oligosaccharide flippase family protein, partial [Hyphomicrobium sp.]